MSRYIVAVPDNERGHLWWLEWSTVVDAPITSAMQWRNFKVYYRNEYGNNGLAELPRRLRRVAETGCSAGIETLQELSQFNRAGPEETHEPDLLKWCREHAEEN
jgi:hypothetical protein